MKEKDLTIKEFLIQKYGPECFVGVTFTLNGAAKLVMRSTSVLSFDLDRGYLSGYKDSRNFWQIEGEELVDWYSIRPDFRTTEGRRFQAMLDGAILERQQAILNTEVREMSDEQAMDVYQLSLIMAAAIVTHCHTVEKTVDQIMTTVIRSFKRIVGGSKVTRAFAVWS